MTDPLASWHGRRIAVLGCGKSGLAVVRRLVEAGVIVHAFDDQPSALDRAAECGAWHGRPQDLASGGLLVVSPGIASSGPNTHPVVAEARRRGCDIVGDVELFYRLRPDCRFVGVTGTNGKSTTASLIHQLLVQSGREASLAGNIGTPVFDLIGLPRDSLMVVELSSFQLETTRDLRCEVAAWLNLTPDHLDRHGDLAGYAAAKERVFANRRPGDVAVVGVDDEPSRQMADRLEAQGREVVRVSVADPLPFAPEVNLALRGTHNRQNVAVARAVLRALGVTDRQIAGAIPSFKGLPHRMEEVRRIANVSFVNDSKATNVAAAVPSLGAFPACVWIAGGLAKTGGFEELRSHLGRVRRAYLIGKAAADMKSALGDLVEVEEVEVLKRAVPLAHRHARSLAPEAVTVLLAPACASFDQFANFEARGDSFRTLVGDLS